MCYIYSPASVRQQAIDCMSLFTQSLFSWGSNVCDTWTVGSDLQLLWWTCRSQIFQGSEFINKPHHLPVILYTL